jgi:hypothetical protein
VVKWRRHNKEKFFVGEVSGDCLYHVGNRINVLFNENTNLERIEMVIEKVRN